MSKPVGGRGKLAPYVSTHVRIPEDIKPYIELIKQQYFDGTLEDFESFSDRLNQDSSKSVLPSIEQAQDFADKLVAQKKSARVSLTKLLEFIYGKHR